MSAALVALLTVIGQIAGTLSNSTAIAGIIKTLTEIIPTLFKEVEDVAPLIQNIIDALKGNAVITPQQLADLDALEAQADAEFEAAVAAIPSAPDAPIQ